MNAKAADNDIYDSDDENNDDSDIVQDVSSPLVVLVVDIETCQEQEGDASEYLEKHALGTQIVYSTNTRQGKYNWPGI